MIKFSHESIFESTAEAWVNPVNCEGVMGAGLAREFKKNFPTMYLAYRSLCEKGTMRIGHLHLFKYSDGKIPRYIINFPTKFMWKNPSRIEYIQRGMRALDDLIRKEKIKSIAIPALGCGKGGLKWEEVAKIIDMHHRKFANDVEFILYPPRISEQ